MKVAENREEPFKKGIATNYVRGNFSFRRNSNVRAGSMPEGKFTGRSRNNS